jgi:hypothetical protein
VLPALGGSEALRAIGVAVVRTVTAARQAMLDGTQSPVYGDVSERCFQIFGFDVLFTQDRKPIILEVNYRPSLAYGTEEEKALKTRMIVEAVKIACDVRSGKKRPQLGRFLQIHPDPAPVVARGTGKRVQK